jgi:hypothetical protein
MAFFKKIWFIKSSCAISAGQLASFTYLNDVASIWISEEIFHQTL